MFTCKYYIYMYIMDVLRVGCANFYFFECGTTSHIFPVYTIYITQSILYMYMYIIYTYDHACICILSCIHHVYDVCIHDICIYTYIIYTYYQRTYGYCVPCGKVSAT